MRGLLNTLSIVAVALLITASGVPVASAKTSYKTSAKTINVPLSQPTIQAGIDAASNGDTVLVAPGTYKENINFNGKAITVTSSGGPAVTTLDGQLLNTAVSFLTNETSTSVLSGFTVQNAFNSGIYIQNASPTIKNNIMILNQGGTAGAIWVNGGSPLIQANLIHNNANAPYSYSQAAINLTTGQGAQIIGNAIFDNSGSGIVNYQSGSTVSNNEIIGNTGSGLNFQFGSLSPSIVAQNLLSGNQLVGFYVGGSNVVAVNNTISGNFGSQYNGESTELEIYTFDSLSSFYNNLIVAQGVAPGFTCDSYNPAAPPNFSNNNVFAANNTAYGLMCPVLTGSNGNLSADPLFVDTLSNDYHLQSGSPAINVGSNSAPDLPKKDFDGDPRIINKTIDVGVDEYSKTTSLSLSSYSMHFGTQNVGTTSAPQSLTLTNHGSKSVTLSLIATGTDYTQTNTCGTALAAGSSCQISVSLAPILGGERAGVLAIFSSGSLNPRTAILSGLGVAPAVSISNTFPNINNQVVGTTGTVTSQLTNTGLAPLTITSITLAGSVTFSQTNDCPIAPATLAPSASCTFTISYTPPLALESDNATITIMDNATPSAQTIYSFGSSVSAGIPVLSTTSLTFPNVNIGSNSAPQTFTLTNAGTGALGNFTIFSYTLDFQVSNTCPLSLAAGASCNITVIFSPTIAATEASYVIVSDDAAIYSTSVTTSGTGVSLAPTITSITPASAPVGSTGANITIIGTNLNNSSQVFVNGILICSFCYGSSTQISVYVPSTSLVTSGIVPITVVNPAPGGGTSNAALLTVFNPISYSYQPTPYNYRTITGTNLNVNYGSTVQLTSPFAIQLGGGSYTTLTVGSTGALSLVGFSEFYPNSIPSPSYDTIVAPFWDALVTSGTNPANNNVFWQVNGVAPNRELVVEWRNVTYCCILPSPNTVRFEVVFEESNGNVIFNYADTVFGGSSASHDNGATASVGIQSVANIGTQFSYNTPSLTSKSALLWYPSSPTPTVSTSILNFGYHQVGTASNPETVTLTNGSTAVLVISSISTNNVDFSQTNTCGTSVASGSSCTITVSVAPSQPGAESGILTIADDGTNSPQTVTLSAIGSATTTEVYPTILNFGTVGVGTTVTMPVTLANAGNAALTIQSVKTSSASFTETNNCGTSLAVGSSCIINVSFTPIQKGAINGVVVLNLNNKLAVKEVTLSGSGS